MGWRTAAAGILCDLRAGSVLNFVLQHYVSVDVEELDRGKLLRLKYHDSIADAVADLGPEIGQIFVECSL